MIPIKPKQKNSSQLNFTFFIFFICFLISFGFLIYGLLNPKKTLKKESKSENGSQETEFKVDEESLSKYFEKTKTSGKQTESDKYLLNDPYLNQCLESSGDNLPSINANTVCLR